jgi:hypothetical protein
VSAAVGDQQGRLHLLTLTLTAGVVVSYSPAPVLAEDATVSRRYVRLPLTDGIGTVLVTAAPERLRIRVDAAGSAAILPPLVVAPSGEAADTVPALHVAVTYPASCRRFRGKADVPRLVHEATRDAGLSRPDVTAVRLLWCRQDGSRGEEALAVSTRRGPDIQCYELAAEGPGRIYETSWRCWPVPRGTGATTPFLAPALPVPDPQVKDLPVTVNAPGAALAEFQATPGGPPMAARAPVAPDGYGRFVVTGTRTEARDLLEREGVIMFLDGRGHPVSVLLVSARHPSDVWEEAAERPVVGP